MARLQAKRVLRIMFYCAVALMSYSVYHTHIRPIIRSRFVLSIKRYADQPMERIEIHDSKGQDEQIKVLESVDTLPSLSPQHQKQIQKEHEQIRYLLDMNPALKDLNPKIIHAVDNNEKALNQPKATHDDLVVMDVPGVGKVNVVKSTLKNATSDILDKYKPGRQIMQMGKESAMVQANDGGLHLEEGEAELSNSAQYHSDADGSEQTDELQTLHEQQLQVMQDDKLESHQIQQDIDSLQQSKLQDIPGIGTIAKLHSEQTQYEHNDVQIQNLHQDSVKRGFYGAMQGLSVIGKHKRNQDTVYNGGDQSKQVEDNSDLEDENEMDEYEKTDYETNIMKGSAKEMNSDDRHASYVGGSNRDIHASYDDGSNIGIGSLAALQKEVKEATANGTKHVHLPKEMQKQLALKHQVGSNVLGVNHKKRSENPWKIFDAEGQIARIANATKLPTTRYKPKDAYEYPEEVDLRVIVMAFNRTSSMKLLLESLAELEMDGDTACMEIWIDRDENDIVHELTVQAAKQYVWKQGPVRVHIQDIHVGTYGQWYDTYRPRIGTKELAFMLEDDMSVSKYAWRWAKAVHQHYHNASMISGYCLHGDFVLKLTDRSPVKLPEMDLVFLRLGSCTWGFVPKPEHWRMVQDWFHLMVQNENFKPFVRGFISSLNFRQHMEHGREDAFWDMWYIHYAFVNKMYILYSNLKTYLNDYRTSFVVHRYSKGLHYHGTERDNNARKLMTKWSPSFVQLPNIQDIPRIDYAGRMFRHEKITNF